MSYAGRLFVVESYPVIEMQLVYSTIQADSASNPAGEYEWKLCSMLKVTPFSIDTSLAPSYFQSEHCYQ